MITSSFDVCVRPVLTQFVHRQLVILNSTRKIDLINIISPARSHCVALVNFVVDTYCSEKKEEKSLPEFEK